MSVDQTRSIIDHAREFHEQVSEYYHRLADAAARTRVRLLLDYMSQHEERLADALTEYEGSAPAKILDTWFQSAGDTDALKTVRKQLESVQIGPDGDVDEVIEVGVQLSECVLAVYRDLAERAEPDSVRQVFESLLGMEEKAQQQFVRDAERLNDL